MPRKIRVTRRADKRFDEIKYYIGEGPIHQSKFVKRVFAFYDVIIQFPRIGTLHDRTKGIYGFVIARQVYVFYRFDDKQAVILNFFDNRTDPSQQDP